jgi:hypothetical protein
MFQSVITSLSKRLHNVINGSSLIIDAEEGEQEAIRDATTHHAAPQRCASLPSSQSSPSQCSVSPPRGGETHQATRNNNTAPQEDAEKARRQSHTPCPRPREGDALGSEVPAEVPPSTLTAGGGACAPVLFDRFVMEQIVLLEPKAPPSKAVLFPRSSESLSPPTTCGPLQDEGEEDDEDEEAEGHTQVDHLHAAAFRQTLAAPSPYPTPLDQLQRCDDLQRTVSAGEIQHSQEWERLKTAAAQRWGFRFSYYVLYSCSPPADYDDVCCYPEMLMWEGNDDESDAVRSVEEILAGGGAFWYFHTFWRSPRDDPHSAYFFTMRLSAGAPGRVQFASNWRHATQQVAHSVHVLWPDHHGLLQTLCLYRVARPHTPLAAAAGGGDEGGDPYHDNCKGRGANNNTVVPQRVVSGLLLPRVALLDPPTSPPILFAPGVRCVRVAEATSLARVDGVFSRGAVKHIQSSWCICIRATTISDVVLQEDNGDGSGGSDATPPATIQLHCHRFGQLAWESLRSMLCSQADYRDELLGSLLDFVDCDAMLGSGGSDADDDAMRNDSHALGPVPPCVVLRFVEGKSTPSQREALGHFVSLVENTMQPGGGGGGGNCSSRFDRTTCAGTSVGGLWEPPSKKSTTTSNVNDASHAPPHTEEAPSSDTEPVVDDRHTLIAAGADDDAQQCPELGECNEENDAQQILAGPVEASFCEREEGSVNLTHSTCSPRWARSEQDDSCGVTSFGRCSAHFKAGPEISCCGSDCRSEGLTSVATDPFMSLRAEDIQTQEAPSEEEKDRNDDSCTNVAGSQLCDTKDPTTISKSSVPSSSSLCEDVSCSVIAKSPGSNNTATYTDASFNEECLSLFPSLHQEDLLDGARSHRPPLASSSMSAAAAFSCVRAVSPLTVKSPVKRTWQQPRPDDQRRALVAIIPKSPPPPPVLDPLMLLPQLPLPQPQHRPQCDKAVQTHHELQSQHHVCHCKNGFHDDVVLLATTLQEHHLILLDAIREVLAVQKSQPLGNCKAPTDTFMTCRDVNHNPPHYVGTTRHARPASGPARENKRVREEDDKSWPLVSESRRPAVPFSSSAAVLPTPRRRLEERRGAPTMSSCTPHNIDPRTPCSPCLFLPSQQGNKSLPPARTSQHIPVVLPPTTHTCTSPMMIPPTPDITLVRPCKMPKRATMTTTTTTEALDDASPRSRSKVPQSLSNAPSLPARDINCEDIAQQQRRRELPRKVLPAAFGMQRRSEYLGRSHSLGSTATTTAVFPAVTTEHLRWCGSGLPSPLYAFPSPSLLGAPSPMPK